MSIKNYKQTDKVFNLQINHHGCYFFSLLFYAEEINKSLDLYHYDIEYLYKIFIGQGWMRENCFIINGIAILNFLDVNVKHVRKEYNHSLKIRTNEIEIACFHIKDNFYHFVPSKNFRILWNSLNLNLTGKNKEGRRIYTL